MTYNICRGVFSTLKQVADVIAAEAPDLLFLQEVDICTTRSQGVDQLAFLSERLEMDGVFGKAWDYLDGQAGSALLSRYPLSDVVVTPLYRGHAKGRAGREEPRICFRATLAHPRQPLSAYSVHFGTMFTSPSPQRQAQEFADIVKNDPLPVIAAGDYNHFPNHVVVQCIAEHLDDASPHPQAATETARYTFPSPYPQVCIDYILHSPSLRAEAHRIVDSQASDHRPVVATIDVGDV